MNVIPQGAWEGLENMLNLQKHKTYQEIQVMFITPQGAWEMIRKHVKLLKSLRIRNILLTSNIYYSPGCLGKDWKGLETSETIENRMKYY